MAATIFLIHSKGDTHHVTEIRKKLAILINKGELTLLSCEQFHENEDDLTPLFDNIAQAHAVIVLLSDNYFFECLDKPVSAMLHEKIAESHKKGKTTVSFVVEDCDWSDDNTITWSVFELDDTFLDKKLNYNFLRDKIKSTITHLEPKYAFKDALHDGLLYLNYDDQRNEIDTHFKGNPNFHLLNILLLRGSEACGLKLLIRKFIFSNEISHDTIYVLNAALFGNSENIDDWLWQELAQRIGMPDGEYTDFEDFAKYLLLERLNKKHLVIRFEGIHKVKTESAQVVEKAWQRLYDYFISSKITTKFSIFLFLTDYSGDDKTYSKAQFQGNAPFDVCDKLVCILSKVKYLNEEGARSWINYIRTERDLKKSIGQHLDVLDIISETDSEIPIAKAVGKIIDKLGQLDKDLQQNKSHFLKRI